MNTLAILSYTFVLVAGYLFVAGRLSAKKAQKYWAVVESERIRGKFAEIRFEVFQLLAEKKISEQEYELIYDLCSNVMRRPDTHKEYGTSFARYIIKKLSVWEPPSKLPSQLSPASHGLWNRLADLLDELALQNSRTLRFVLAVERLLDPDSNLWRRIERTQEKLKKKELAKLARNQDHERAKKQLGRFATAL
jgi:hypothetical protein